MGLVLVDMLRLSKIAEQIDKIEKLKKRYGVGKNTPVSIADSIKIVREFSKYVVSVNGNRWVAVDTGIFSGVRVVVSTPTLGAVKGPYRFLTTDKTAQTTEYIEKIWNIIKDNIPILEQAYMSDSAKAWNV